MPREKPDYRDNIYLLNLRFPDHDMLTIPEIMTTFGWKSRNTAVKHIRDFLGLKKGQDTPLRLSKATVARMMCAA